MGKRVDRVKLLLAMMDDAYEGSQWHSLKGGLRGLTAEEMHFKPVARTLDVKERGRAPYLSTIGRKLVHVALCKVMYQNHAFGGRTLDWGKAWEALNLTEAITGPRKLVLDRAQAGLRDTLAGLTDRDLDRKVFTNWGEKVPAWWIFNSMVQHDLYHGAQIRTLRAMYRIERLKARKRSRSA